MSDLDELVRTFVKQLEREIMAPKNSDRHRWRIVLAAADASDEFVHGIEPRVVDGCLIINNERDLDVVFYAAGTWRFCEYKPKAAE